MAVDSHNLDIFGKPLGLSDGEKAVLGEDVRVVLRRELQAETHAKKGDQTEPKILAISRSRCYFITKKSPIKIETSFNFLKIKLLECTEKKLSFHLEEESRPRELLAEKNDSIMVAALIQAQLRNLFNTTSSDSVLKALYSPEGLGTEVSLLQDTLRQAMESLDPNSLESFITIYGFMCDYYGTPYLEDVSYYLRIVYMTHAFRVLDISDFEYLSNRDLLPLMSAIRHSQYFDGLSAKNMKLSPDVYDSLSETLIHSNTLKNLTLDNCSVKPEILFQYTVAWKSSSKSVLAHLDLSNNPLEEKTLEHFCTAMESMQHGLKSLVLSNCKLTPKVGSLIAQSMKKNQDLIYSLTHFDLSANPQLGSDPQGTLVFIQEPQTIATLDLSKCGMNFDVVFPVLIRGCQQHLRELNLSQNKPKKNHILSVGHSMQQFFSSAISLETIDLSDCKLPAELAIAIMEGLSVNPNIDGTSLNLSCNELNHSVDVSAMSNVMSRMKNISDLDLSNTGIGLYLSRLLEAIGLNRTVRHLKIGQNFDGKGRVEGIRQLCRLVQSQECSLESLGVADSKLKELTPHLLSSLIPNDTIRKLDISGNNMGPSGVRSLAKLLLSGSILEEIHYAHNDIPAVGFTNIADALEHNFNLRSLPTPLYDVSKVVGKEGVEDSLARIQRYLCRNHSDERFSIELAKRHQHRLLLTSQQSSLISREIIEVEEMLTKIEKRNIKEEGTGEEKNRAVAIKEEANKVVQLVDSLYSPHQESQQYEAISKRMHSVIEREVEQLYAEFVQENMERMVTQGVKACPSFLDDTTRETLRQIGHRELSGELAEAKKAVIKKTAPEVVNHISGMNLETAAVISEIIVDRTLTELEGSTDRLHRILDKTASASPSKRISKIFSFRTRDQDKVKGKRRVRRDDNEEEEEIFIPSSPLQTDGPSLQHLNKNRPRPVRHHRRKPTALRQQAGDIPDSVWESAAKQIEEPDTQKASKSGPIKPKTPEPMKPKTPEPVKPKTPEPAKERLPEPVKPKTPEPAKEKLPEPVKPKTQEVAKEKPPEPVKPKTPEPAKQKPSEPVKPKTPEPAKQKAPEPVIKPETPESKSKESAQVAPSPGRSDETKKDKRRSGISRLFGSRKEKHSPPTEKRASEIVADEYIVVDKKKSPPHAPAKPQKQKIDEEEASEQKEEKREGWKPPAKSSNTSAGQLASVLKQGVPIQLKSAKPTKEENKQEGKEVGGDKTEPPTSPTRKISAPPVANKPKKGSIKDKSNQIAGGDSPLNERQMEEKEEKHEDKVKEPASTAAAAPLKDKEDGEEEQPDPDTDTV